MKVFSSSAILVAMLVSAAFTQAQVVYDCNDNNPCHGTGEICCQKFPDDNMEMGTTYCFVGTNCPVPPPDEGS